MDVTYRPAKLEDLESATRIVQRAYNELRRCHGLRSDVGAAAAGGSSGSASREDPDGLWIAEGDGAPIGFGFGWMRQRFWYLAQLFVGPDTQAKGVGQALLTRTLGQAERNGAENRALITMAYNTASTGLYIRNGLYPREPLHRMAAPASVVRRTAGPALDVASIEPWPGCREWLGRIDDEVLGFRRESHHAFLLGFTARAVRIEQAGRPVGYAYISAEGHVGPLAVARGADARCAVLAAIRCALEGRPQQVSMIVPGKADRILRTVSDLGFRIDEPFVLLAARPFGDWRNYLPSNPGFM